MHVIPGEQYTEHQLVERVLDFAAEQLAADDIVDAVKNLGVHPGSGEEYALNELAKGCTKRTAKEMHTECPEVLYLVQKAKEFGAVAAAPAGYGAAWAIIKVGRRADALAFEAAWRHAHSAEYDAPCDMFISTPTGPCMQYERGNYFD